MSKSQRVPWHSVPIEVVGLPKRLWSSETGFQIWAATWLRKYKPNLWFHHSANERVGGRSGLLCKLKGQSKGFPDFLIFPKLAIELKIPGGKLSPEQFKWIVYLESLGWACHVVYNADQLMDVVK